MEKTHEEIKESVNEIWNGRAPASEDIVKMI